MYLLIKYTFIRVPMCEDTDSDTDSIASQLQTILQLLHDSTVTDSTLLAMVLFVGRLYIALI